MWWNGRHASLRGWCSKERAGSNPVIRTVGIAVRYRKLGDALAICRLRDGLAGSHITRLWRNGRRGSLRSYCPQGRGGSNPLNRTFEA